MARQPEGGYMAWPAAPRWMEPLLADDGGRNQMVSISRLANAELERLRESGGGGGGGGGGGLCREDLRFPVDPRGKYQAASGPYPQNDGDDRLIPGDGKILYMSCGQPSKYLPRRRKLPPTIDDNRILSFNYAGNAAAPAAPTADPAGRSHGAGVPRAPDVSSVTGREYSRRRMIPQPEGFFNFQGQTIKQSSNQSLRRLMFEDKT